MKRPGAVSWVLLGMGLCVGLSGDVVADDERRGTLRWSVTDEDGNRTEETIEWDGKRAFLGVDLGRDRDGGARIDSIEEDSAAERAGLRAGDVIVGFDGQDIETPWDLTRAVLKAEPGDRVDIEVLRDGRRRTVTAELGERESGVGAFAFAPNFQFDSERFAERMEQLGERLGNLQFHFEPGDFDFDADALAEQMEELGERLGNMEFHFEPGEFETDFGHRWHFGAASRPRLGVELVDVTDELRRHFGAREDEGLLVGKVLEGTPAADAGVEVGDLIVSIDGESIGSVRDLRRLLRERDGERFDLEVLRDGRPVNLRVDLPEREEEQRGTNFGRPARWTPAASDRT